MSNPPAFDPVPIWFGIGVVLALFVGTVAGILSWLSGQDPPAAILTGGASFGGVVLLAVAVITLLYRRR